MVRQVRRRRVAHRLVFAGVHVAELIRNHLQVPRAEVAQAVVLVQYMVLARDRMSLDALLPLAPHSVLCRSPGCARASGHVGLGPELEANECFNRPVGIVGGGGDQNSSHDYSWGEGRGTDNFFQRLQKWRAESRPVLSASGFAAVEEKKK